MVTKPQSPGTDPTPSTPEEVGKIDLVLSLLDMEFDKPTATSILMPESVLRQLESRIKEEAHKHNFDVVEWGATVRRGGEKVGVHLKRIFKSLDPTEGEGVLKKEVIIFKIDDEDSWNDVRLQTFIEDFQNLAEAIHWYSDKVKGVVVAFIVFGDELFKKVTRHWNFMGNFRYFDDVIYPEDLNEASGPGGS